jgi:hypothetical protein
VEVTEADLKREYAHIRVTFRYLVLLRSGFLAPAAYLRPEEGCLLVGYVVDLEGERCRLAPRRNRRQSPPPGPKGRDFSGWHPLVSPL